MSYEDHLKSCSYCQKRQKPTIRVKGASSYRKERKLSELASIIRGVSYPGISYIGTKVGGTRSAEEIKTNAKGASSQLEKQSKLRELARLVRPI